MEIGSWRFGAQVLTWIGQGFAAVARAHVITTNNGHSETAPRLSRIRHTAYTERTIASFLHIQTRSQCSSLDRNPTPATVSLMHRRRSNDGRQSRLLPPFCGGSVMHMRDLGHIRALCIACSLQNSIAH